MELLELSKNQRKISISCMSEYFPWLAVGNDTVYFKGMWKMLVTFDCNMLPGEKESHSTMPMQTSVLGSVHTHKGGALTLPRKFCGLECTEACFKEIWCQHSECVIMHHQ